MRQWLVDKHGLRTKHKILRFIRPVAYLHGRFVDASDGRLFPRVVTVWILWMCRWA